MGRPKGAKSKTRAAEEKAGLIKRFEASSLTGKGFGMANGVCQPLFDSWLAKRKIRTRAASIPSKATTSPSERTASGVPMSRREPRPATRRTSASTAGPRTSLTPTSGSTFRRTRSPAPEDTLGATTTKGWLTACITKPRPSIGPSRGFEAFFFRLSTLA